MSGKRALRADKMAKIYDAEMLPVWGHRFGKMLLRDLKIPPKAMVLDVGCGTGYPALELLKRMTDDGRIIAIDAASAMLDEARKKAGALSGKRIFFRSENAWPKLPFAADVYDTVICNSVLQEMEDPELAIREFVRVTRPDGEVRITLPLAGTFAEFHDLLREVLIKSDRKDAIDRLDLYLSRYPPLEQARAWFEDAGCVDIHAEYEIYTLLFKSSREFFFAPVIEFGPLVSWKEIAGTGAQMQSVFWQCKQAIDTYFAGSSFAVTIVAGCVRGRKSADIARDVTDDDVVDEDIPTHELRLVTDEIDVIEASRELERERDDDDSDPIL